MAELSGISIDYNLSPRIARLAAPATTLSLQDYVDTLRVREDDFQAMSFPFLISASGKEDLGDGVSVGITVQEQNLRLSFEPRRTPAETGTVTTASGFPNSVGRYTFSDSTADFVTAGIDGGSLLINWTDRSVADVVRVIDSTTLEIEALVNGTDNLMSIGDDYAVWNIVQVRVSAGNLTAVDDLAASINAVQPSAFTQVVVAQASQSTLVSQDLSSIDTQLTEINTNTQPSAQASAVWDALITSYQNSGTFGAFVTRQLLTVAKFFALR